MQVSKKSLIIGGLLGFACGFVIFSCWLSSAMGHPSQEMLYGLVQYSALLEFAMWIGLTSLIVVLVPFIFYRKLQNKTLSWILGAGPRIEEGLPSRATLFAVIGISLAFSLMGLLQVNVLSFGNVGKSYGSLTAISDMRTIYWPSLRLLAQPTGDFNHSDYKFGLMRYVFIQGRAVPVGLSLDVLAFVLLSSLIYRGYVFVGAKES